MQVTAHTVPYTPDMLSKVFVLDSTVLSSDAESFKRQEALFVILNLFVLAVLLLTHSVFSSYWGSPPVDLIVVLAIGFFLNVCELIWVQTRPGGLSPMAITVLTWGAIVMNMLLAFILAALSDRQDLEYFALLVVPVLESAFRLPWYATVVVVSVAGSLDFFWVWWYFESHPPVVIGEYFEAGTISLIYVVMGLLVWLLVNNLRQGQQKLRQSLDELVQTKRRLSSEEKLAAIGRLSSGIAHEVRNPVAMISSSLESVLHDDLDDPARREMLGIAARESSRLEKLTSDFLAYARPDNLERQACELLEILEYVAAVCRPHAARESVTISVSAPAGVTVMVDPERVQQALLNLLKNAMEASTRGGAVCITGSGNGDEVRIDIENGNGPIAGNVVDLLFEPFFSTKPNGTGLGLAISRKIARAHEGDVMLAANDVHLVRFSITLPVGYRANGRGEAAWAGS